MTISLFEPKKASLSVLEDDRQGKRKVLEDSSGVLSPSSNSDRQAALQKRCADRSVNRKNLNQTDCGQSIAYPFISNSKGMSWGFRLANANPD